MKIQLDKEETISIYKSSLKKIDVFAKLMETTKKAILSAVP